MNRALKEAYRTLSPNKINYESEAVRSLKETLQIPKVDHEKWIKLPRKYSRADNRFELPIDSRQFKGKILRLLTRLNSNPSPILRYDSNEIFKSVRHCFK